MRWFLIFCVYKMFFYFKSLKIKILLFFIVFFVFNLCQLLSQEINQNANQTTNQKDSLLNIAVKDTNYINKPILEQGFEPFLEFNSRNSNTTPLTDRFDTQVELNDDLTPSNLYDLPAIDVKTANKIYELVNDSLITEMNKFIDSLDYYNSINQNQYVVIDKIIEEKITDKVLNKKRTSNKSKFIYRIRNQSRFSDISGIENGKFQGDDLDLFQRMMYRDENFFAVIQSKKAVGELNINEFMSGSLSFKNDNMKIIIGDFMPTIGYGSVFWSSFAATKGTDIISPILRLSKGIEPNTSVINLNIFRGISLETNYDINENTNLKLRTFYANNFRTTNLNDSNEVTSISIVPQFRTESEITKRDNLNEKNYTFNLELTNSKNIYGILYTKFKYNKELNPTSDNYFDRNDTEFASFYTMNTIDNFTFGTEFVSDKELNLSLKLSTQTNWDNLIWTNNLRISSPKIKSMYGYSFGEFNNITNQFSIYNAFEYKGFEKFRFYHYSEFYRSINQINSLPSYQSGLDLFLETEYLLDKNNKLINRLKYENKRDADNSEDFNQRVMFLKSRYEFRLELHSILTKTAKLRVRYEQNFITYSKLFNNENGSLVYIELQKQLFEGLKLNARYTIFNTDSFNSAIWQYEYAVPGYTTTTSLFDKGSRFLTSLEYDYSQSLTLFLRYSSTLFNNKEILGSGNLQINDNNNNRIIFQIDLKI